MKTGNQKAIEILEGNNKRAAYYKIKNFVSNTRRSDCFIGDTFIEMIAKHGVGAIKDLASKCVELEVEPTKEEAIGLTNELFDKNYINHMDEVVDEGRQAAYDVLKEIHPTYSDEKIWSFIG